MPSFIPSPLGSGMNLPWPLCSLWKPFFGPDLAYRTMRTVQQEVRRSTHYRRDTKLGRAFYLGLAKHAEKCTMQSLEKMRARQSPYRSTPRAANFSDFLKRDLLDGEHLQELEAFLEAGGSVAQAALWHKLGDQFNRSLQGRLGTRNPLEVSSLSPPGC